MLKSCPPYVLLAIVLLWTGVSAFGQTITVTGSVYDALSGAALIGVNVNVEGTGLSATTNATGNFTISNVPVNGTLIVNTPGYERGEMPVNGMSSVEIPMYPSGFTFDSYYSRQSGDWENNYTWSYLSHTGPPAYDVPGSTGCNVYIGTGHTVTFTTDVSISACQLDIASGASLDMGGHSLEVGGTFNINGPITNPGELIVGFCALQINTSLSSPPVFDRLTINNLPGCEVILNTDIVLLNGFTVSGGTFNPNGYVVYNCIPPSNSPSGGFATNQGGTSMTLNWTRGNGAGGVMVVMRESGQLQQKPQPGTNYTANAAFGSGDATGPQNFVVYKGTGTSATITNLQPNTYYEIGVYEFNGTSCYNVSSFLGMSEYSGCADPGSPTNPVNSTYCVGQSATPVSVDDPGIGYSITWYDAPSGGTFPPGANTAGATNNILIPVTAGTYYAAIIDESECESVTRTAVTVTQASDASVSPATSAICSGATTSISLSGSPQFSWTVLADASVTGAAPSSGFVSATSIAQQLVNNSSVPQQVVYTITPSTGCPGSPLTATVTVDPAIPVFNVTGGGSFCAGQDGVPVGLSGSTAGVDYELFLNGSPTGIRQMAGSGTFDFPLVTVAGQYTVRGRVSANCMAMMNGSVDVVMNVAPSGTGVIGGNTPVCVGLTEQYQVTGIANADTYEWRANDELLPSDQAIASLTISGSSDIVLTVVGINECGRGGQAQRTLIMLPPPTVDIVLPEDVYAEETALFGYSANAIPQSTTWSFGDGNSSGTESPSHTYLAGGAYEVTVDIIVNGCVGQDTKTLVVKPKASMSDAHIKNAVTANGDEKNAYLYIQDIHKFPDSEVILLDRWGVEVFRKTGYQNDWDLVKDGDYLPAGNYVCVVKLNETGQVFKRTVTVIKTGQ